MKTKIIIVFGLIFILILIKITWDVRGKIDLKNFNSEKIITERQHALEIAEYNSRDYPVEYDEDWYKLKLAQVRKEMKEVVDQSHQDPEKNEEYDQTPVEEDLDWWPDDTIDDFDISILFERIDSTEAKYVDPRLPEDLKFEAFYHYSFGEVPPYFNFKYKPLIFNDKKPKRFGLMFYMGMDSYSLELEYEPWDWIRIGIQESMKKLVIDGEEKIYFNSMIGGGINF